MCIYIYMHKYIHICTRLDMYTNIYTHTHTLMYLYMCIVCIFIFLCMCTRTFMSEWTPHTPHNVSYFISGGALHLRCGRGTATILGRGTTTKCFPALSADCPQKACRGSQDVLELAHTGLRVCNVCKQIWKHTICKYNAHVHDHM